MRPALAIFCLFLFCDTTPLSAQTFGLGGLTEYRPVRAQVFGLGEATVKPRLQVQPATVRKMETVQATNKESSLVQPAATVREIRSVQPQVVCIDGKCYPQPTRQVFQRQPLFRRWR